MPLDPIEASLLPEANRILSVSAFTRQVKDLLENRFPELWIRGEVSNFRRQSSGHCYFSLKDEGSQVSAVIFRGDAANQRLDLRDGLQVVAFGEVSVYEPRGNYQIIVRFMVEDGLGRLQQEFERLKQKLAGEGLFDPEKKKPIPLLPRTVGIVTSPTGAAVRDFISILRRRGWRGRLVVLPAKVQGTGAAEEIVSKIKTAERMGIFDLLVVGRGGGSLEDLWPFNEETVARAVAACPIPVISAVGHEIDFTLSDFAADKRAETPSSAAEIITSHYLDTVERLEYAGEAMLNSAENRVERVQQQLELLGSRLLRVSPVNRIEQSFLRLDDLTNRLSSGLRNGISEGRHRLQDITMRLAQASPERRMELAGERLEQLSHRLRNASPDQILKRGFVLVKDAEGRLVSRKAPLHKGQKLRNQFADGEVEVEITDL